MSNIRNNIRTAVRVAPIVLATKYALSGQPVMAQNAPVRPVPTDTVQNVDSAEIHQNELYRELRTGFSFGHSRTAAKKKAGNALAYYMGLLADAKDLPEEERNAKLEEARAYMEGLWNNFEAKRTAVLREETYTVKANDPKALQQARLEARAAYEEYMRLNAENDMLTARLDSARTQDSIAFAAEDARMRREAAERGEDTLNLPEVRHETPINTLKIDVARAQTRKSFAAQQVESATKDAKLYFLRLKKDLADEKINKALTEEDIEKWLKLQKQIEAKEKEMAKYEEKDNPLGELKKEKKPDAKTVNSELDIANENLANALRYAELKQEKERLEAEQNELGTLESLNEKLAEIERKIAEIEAKLADIRAGRNVEDEDLLPKGYEGSSLEAIANKVKEDQTGGHRDLTVEFHPVSTLSGNGKAQQTGNTRGNRTTPFAEKISKIKMKLASQSGGTIAVDSVSVPGYVTTEYTHQDGTVDKLREYPDGRVCLWPVDGQVTLYRPNGDEFRYELHDGTKVTEYQNDAPVENSSVTQITDVLQIFSDKRKESR